MKIGIDIQSTVGKKTGIGFYTEHLLNEFKQEKSIDFYGYSSPIKTDLNSLQRMYWENISLERMAKKDKVDILHVPGFAGPLRKGKYKKITTVHDLIGIIFPENLGAMSRFYWKKWLPACIKNSDAIISVSEYTKQDIIRLLNIPAEKIHVVLSAAEKKFVPISQQEQLDKIQQKYHLPDKFILNVGSVEPRKNIPGLIKAFASYVKESQSDLNLVIVGKKDWGYDKAYQVATEEEILSRIVFTDYVYDEDLPTIYNLAEFFVLPSFYEGFGLPVLEAMSCGRPVICSNVSSLPEISQDAAILIDPHSVSDLKEALRRLDSSKEIREEYSSRALKRAKEFSWEDAAAKTVEVYKKIY